MTIAEQLAELAASLKLAALPPEVAHAGRRALLDTLGVAIGGSRGPAAAAVRRAYAGRTGAGLSLVLDGGEADAEIAALCNGVAAHSLEMDDYHRAATVHPGAVAVPAALAVAQEQKVDGARLLESVIAGYEVAIRVGMATRGVLYRFGFHPTAVVGVFGAAAAAARAMDLDPERTAHAIGLAGTRASGLAAHKVRGDWSKRLQAGTSAAQGLGAARLAAAGFTGPLEVVEGLYGFVFAYARGEARAEDSLEGLGEQFHTPGVSFKPYPSCRFTHAPMDALLAAQRQGNVRPEEIRRIECAVNAQAMASVMTPMERKYRPETPVDAQFSLPYCLAVVVMKGQAPLEVFQPAALGDAVVLEMASRVVAAEDPAYTALFPARNAARVSLHTNRGVFTSEVLDAKGDPESPMSDADLEAKFVALAGPVLGEGVARDLAGLVWSVDRQPSLDGITELLRLGRSPSG